MTSSANRAVVVGSGPNGLAAALTLAESGLEVDVFEAANQLGGGMRSAELTLPGLIHDECAGFHPLAVDNPFTREFRLQEYGLEWAWPDVQYSHPLDGGRGSAAFQSVTETADGLGVDGVAWARTFGAISRRFPDIAESFLRPLMRLPRSPIPLAQFGLRSAQSAQFASRHWSTDEARALFAGVAAHAMRPLTSIGSAGIGMALGAAAHSYGWPVAKGGSGAIATAMARRLGELGVTFHLGVEVEDLAQVGPATVTMLDVAPAAAVRIVGAAVPTIVRRSLERYRHGPGVFKVDFAIAEGVPWDHEPSRRAGTVHVGGTLEEIVIAEREVNLGRMPTEPFVLVGQQYVADPSRAHEGVVPLYAYAHVPAGWPGDATEAIERQIERFAPGFRDRILARTSRSVSDFSAGNANYVDGDVVGGANTVRQLLFRPRPAIDPYSLGVPGVYLCSAATPPGAGAHGMCGWNAAKSALKHCGW